MVRRSVTGGALACALLLAVLVPDAPGARAPAEIQRPKGEPRGIVLLIHGGGWTASGPEAVATVRGDARRFTQRGWLTYNVDHRPLQHAFADVRRTYDRLRRRHPRIRICVHGVSSGGHLALMLAQRRPSVDCVIAVGAPSDLAHWPRRARAVYDVVRSLRRRVSLRRWSPVRQARRIRQPVLLIHDQNDQIVPFAQSRRLARRLPHAELVGLCPGPVAYVHTNVAPACLRRAYRAEARLLRRLR
jgi:dipeptidyl aminopeptidase/acylaminoacyl peptidase